MKYFQICTIRYGYALIGLMLVGVLGIAGKAHAEVDFLTSWHTKTYVPAWYEGKAFPTYQSFVSVNFELVENGKMADLSKTAVRWYVDDKLLKNETNGLGIRQMTVFNKKYGGDLLGIKIVIPDYKGQALTKLLDIPVKKPEVVIDAPYFQKKIAKGDHAIYAWPLFFNAADIDDLVLQWTVDGNALTSTPASDPLLLFTVGNEVQPGTKSTIEATIINRGKAIEKITKKVFVDIL